MLVFLVGCMEDEAVTLGISLRERRDTVGNVCWQITNTRDAPVTIHRVLFNAEWEPAIAEIRDAGRGREYWSPSEQWVAVRRLTIGESCSVFQKGTRFANDRRNYGKEVIYIDLYTDRGNFRYRPSEGFKALPD